MLDFAKLVLEETNRWRAEHGMEPLPASVPSVLQASYETPEEYRRQNAESRGQTRRTESDDLREGDLAGRIEESRHER